MSSSINWEKRAIQAEQYRAEGLSLILDGIGVDIDKKEAAYCGSEKDRGSTLFFFAEFVEKFKLQYHPDGSALFNTWWTAWEASGLWSSRMEGEGYQAWYEPRGDDIYIESVRCERLRNEYGTVSRKDFVKELDREEMETLRDQGENMSWVGWFHEDKVKDIY